MKLYLNGEQIASYNPSDLQWWITSFCPAYQNIDAANLSVLFTNANHELK